MDINMFKHDYDKWVEENLSDYKAGKFAEAIKNIP
jgi:hypothetical protein